MRVLLSCLLLTTTLLVSAQHITYRSYNWEAERDLIALDEKAAEEYEIILKDKRGIEFTYDKDGGLVEYYLRHKIVRVNSDDAIERNNRIYLPLQNVEDVIAQKARVITKDKKVKELDESDIKEAVDEQNKRSYKYFALEGVEKGSEIEYFYVIKLWASYRGTREILQSNIPKRDVTFQLVAPPNLKFAMKSLNGWPEMVHDTANKDMNVYTGSVDVMDPLKEELFSVYEANLQQVLYKLDENTLTGTKDIVSYGVAAETVFQQMYVDIPRSTGKKLDKLIKQLGADSGDEESRIRKIEQHIKKKINLVAYDAEELGEIEKILENSLADERGLIRLYVALLERMNIQHELVLTSDRFNIKMDKDFESYNFLSNYLIHFPTIKKFLAPSSILNRLGYIPFEWTYNYGLFIRPLRIGNFETALGTVEFIDAPPAEANYDNIFLTANLDDLGVVNASLRREFFGYYAITFQPVYDYIDDEAKENINDQLVKLISEDAEVKKVSIENEGTKHFGKDPFILEADLSSENFMVQAGDKYLFKIGEMIGPQVEMYQEEKRKLEVENDFNRKYYRQITFDIPDGYRIPNLDDLNMDIFHEADSARTAAFTSRYEQDNKTIVVKVDEYYHQMNYPVEDFEAYRSVINAAADFNKITLILEKE